MRCSRGWWKKLCALCRAPVLCWRRSGNLILIDIPTNKTVIKFMWRTWIFPMLVRKVSLVQLANDCQYDHKIKKTWFWFNHSRRLVLITRPSALALVMRASQANPSSALQVKGATLKCMKAWALTMKLTCLKTLSSLARNTGTRKQLSIQEFASSNRPGISINLA